MEACWGVEYSHVYSCMKNRAARLCGILREAWCRRACHICVCGRGSGEVGGSQSQWPEMTRKLTDYKRSMEERGWNISIYFFRCVSIVNSFGRSLSQWLHILFGKIKNVRIFWMEPQTAQRAIFLKRNDRWREQTFKRIVVVEKACSLRGCFPTDINFSKNSDGGESMFSERTCSWRDKVQKRRPRPIYKNKNPFYKDKGFLL